MTAKPRQTAIVCGGRQVEFSIFSRWGQILRDAFNTLQITHVIHGGTQGADVSAGNVALAMGLHVFVVAAQWSKHGRAAGPMRNAEMLTIGPDVVLALPGGRGTADMCRQARKVGVEVIELATLRCAPAKRSQGEQRGLFDGDDPSAA